MTSVAVRGKYVAPDGTAASGYVTFTPRVPAANGPSAIMVGEPVRAALDVTGSFAAILQATDDPAVAPAGWTYQVREFISGAASGRAYDIGVPAAAAGPGIDLVTVAPVPAGGGTPTAFLTLTTAAATYAPLSVLAYDLFTGATDAASAAGRTPVTGPAWQVTGPQGVGLASGFAASTGVGYLYAPGDPEVLACDVAFGGSAAGGPMTMAWSTGVLDLNNLVHVNFGASVFAVTVRKDGVFSAPILSGAWDRPLAVDGSVYRIVAAIEGDRVVLTGPSGQTYASPPDPRIAALHGGSVFWEPNNVSGSSSKLQAVMAYDLVDRRLDGYARLGQLAAIAASMTPNTLVGAPQRRHQVAIGQGAPAALGMPAISFGADQVMTRLSAAVSIGGTSITTEGPVPTGSTVTLDGGTNAETVTTTASPTGTGPYVSTITALTKAHAAGAAVQATPPATARASMYHNAETGYFYLPNAVLVALQSALYMNANLLTYVQEASASGVLQIAGPFGTGKGGLLTGNGATAARPSAAAVPNGTQWFDTQIHKPIWSDGTNWRDAAGSIV